MDALGAVSNALHMAAGDVAHTATGRPLSTACLNEIAALLIVELGEQGFAVVATDEVPS